MSEFAVLTGRCVRLSRRNVDAVVTSIALPVCILLLFVELFGGELRTGVPYVQYVVPGVLILCVTFVSGVTAVTVAADLQAGVVDRFRAMDVSGAGFLGAHVVASAARNALSTVLVVLVALGLGYRSSAGLGHWLLAAGVLAAFVVAVSWFAALLGLLAGSPEAANGFTFALMFAAYPSSAFVRVSSMPTWLQGFARHQPVTPVADSMRSLLLGTGHAPVITALAWSGGIAALSLVACAIGFRRRTA